MEQIIPIIKPKNDTLARLMEIWESAVTETHTFLSRDDIDQIKPDVKTAFLNIEQLYCFLDNEKILGFIGIEKDKIEMLFIDSDTRGKGVGKQLLEYAVTNLDARFVDVNEQNTQGVGFYKHMGFSQIGRSELDEQGRPFPILHMKIQ